MVFITWEKEYNVRIIVMVNSSIYYRTVNSCNSYNYSTANNCQMVISSYLDFSILKGIANHQKG